MSYIYNLPYVFQLRKTCIIAFEDKTILGNNRKKNTNKTRKTDDNHWSESSRKRMKKTIQRWEYYLTHNYNQNKKELAFITLTISSKMKPEIDHNRMLKYFIQRLQYTIGKFNYLWKIEFQENGNIHWHIMQDKKVDWRVVRGIWNNTQKTYVDEYQVKMKTKYKNGFYYDKNMKDKNGKIIETEIQERRYKQGRKANWRNPNSTDVKIITQEEYNQIGNYINKYITKKEEEKQIKTEIKINRYWSCNKELTNLKYPTITEDQLTNIEIEKITNQPTKIIRTENWQEICRIIEFTETETIKKVETETIKKTNEQLNKKIEITEEEKKRIEKKLKQYEELQL